MVSDVAHCLLLRETEESITSINPIACSLAAEEDALCHLASHFKALTEIVNSGRFAQEQREETPDKRDAIFERAFAAGST